MMACGMRRAPRYPYANWLADDPLVEARVIWWQAYHQKMDGFLYWGLNIWGRENNDYLIDPEVDGPRLEWSITTGGQWPALHGDGRTSGYSKRSPRSRHCTRCDLRLFNWCACRGVLRH